MCRTRFTYIEHSSGTHSSHREAVSDAEQKNDDALMEEEDEEEDEEEEEEEEEDALMEEQEECSNPRIIEIVKEYERDCETLLTRLLFGELDQSEYRAQMMELTKELLLRTY